MGEQGAGREQVTGLAAGAGLACAALSSRVGPSINSSPQSFGYTFGALPKVFRKNADQAHLF